MIHSGHEFNVTNEKVRDLTLEPLQKVANKEPLDGNDLKNLEESLPLIELIIAFDPSTLEGYALKGKVLKATGDLNGALRTLQFGLGIATIDQGTYPDLIRADMYSEAAAIYAMKGGYKDAQFVLRNAIQLAPSDPRFLYEAADYSSTTGQVDEALGYLERVFEIDSDYPRAKSLWRSLKQKSGG